MNPKENAYHVARIAIRFRRSEVIKYWVDSYAMHNMDDMLFWSKVLEGLNDAHAFLLQDGVERA